MGQAQNKLEFPSEDSILVNRIILDGNSKTKDSYLLRKLGIDEGDGITYQELAEAVNKLARLNGVYQAKITEIEPTTNGKNIRVSLAEQKTLLPILGFAIIENNSWVQIGFIDINLRGIGDELMAYYLYNEGRHSGQLYYKNNNINGSKWGAHFNLLRWNSLEPLNFNNSRLQYDYINSLVGLGLHYEFNTKTEFQLSSSFFEEKYHRILKGNNLEGPESLVLDKLLNKLEYTFSSFSYDGVLKDGIVFTPRYQNVYTFEYRELFHILEFYGSYFIQKGKSTNIGFRGHVGFANNFDSPFAPFTLDSYINVRGAGNRVLRGTALLSANVEWRETIWNQQYWNFQAVVFSDIGFVRKPGRLTNDFLSKEQSRKSIGLGSRISYKKIYNATLRIDIAYELTIKQFGLVIGLGQYF